MAIIRSQVKKNTGASWLGIKTGKISKITDLSEKYGWADVFLQVEFDVEGSDYPRTMKIAGSFDRDASGMIEDCSLLKRLTHFLDALGEMGGINTEGKWENEDGTPIADIILHLNKYLGTELTIYVFRELAKNGMAYTRVHNKVLAVNPKSEEELEGYIKFLKTKGFIKEAPEGHVNPDTPNAAISTPQVEGLDIASL
ncbi:MAG: hypothetical protein CMM25_05520 [Rhodospirillaceae bacterium]|nr:hypothetical protein [Rhodospirillaceae bacterium]|tara:strand:+ start:1062 stop:1655 length:594 start_codon:yes stop_codon:yes gene_type:complete